MFKWLETANQNYVTVATAVIALVLTVIVARYAMIPYHAAKREKRILDTRTWDSILRGLQTDRAARYFGAIEASVGWFDRVYGPKLISYRAFDRALLFAFIYAILTVLIGWTIFDAGQLGGVAFMPEGLPFWLRMVSLASTMAFVALVCATYIFETQFKTAIAARLAEALGRSTRHTGPLARIKESFTLHTHLETIKLLTALIHLLIAIGIFGGAVAIASAVARIDAGAFAITAAIIGALAIAGAVANASSAAGAVAIVIVIVLFFAIGSFFASTPVSSFPYFQFDSSTLSDRQIINYTTIILFLTVLPLLNALADFLSIAATRSFLRRIAAQRKTAVQVLVGVGIDLVIAALCLGLLLGSIIVTLDLWRDLAPATLTFDWRAYRDELCAGDWQRGTMLWLMLSTTLAPTALHLAAGFGAVFAHSAQIDEKIAAILRPARDALVAKYGAEAFESDHEARTKSVLNADLRHSLEDLLGHKEGAQRWLTVALFIGFMVLMMGAVILAANQFALPQLCPGP
jgi:hypothetical protein